MSVSNEYSYELERKRKREIYLNRISKTTEEFYYRYLEKYETMKNTELASYIPSEIRRLETDLSQLRNLLITDPEEARELSFEIGSYIRSMKSLALSAREQFERTERMRLENLRIKKEYQKNILIDEYFEILKTITNPIVVNYSIEGMQQLRNDIENGKLTSITNLRKISSFVISEAKSKADEWKKDTIKKNRKKDMEQAIVEVEERVKRERIEDPQKTQELIARIRKLRVDLDTDTLDVKSIESQVIDLENMVDQTLITEEVRREAVMAIIKQLKSQEFMVDKPQLIQADEKNYVKIIAKQPSGKKAVCNVDLQGKIAYRFDNYEGMTCLKDIEKFNIDLDKVYSIKLSDERVLWRNPDRLSRDANSLPNNEGRNV